jgi:hypothetical protein
LCRSSLSNNLLKQHCDFLKSIFRTSARGCR